MPAPATKVLQDRSRTGLFANRLVRELFVVVMIKLLVLYGLWLAFFRQPDTQPLTPEQVGAALAGHSANTPESRAAAIGPQ